MEKKNIGKGKHYYQFWYRNGRPPILTLEKGNLTYRLQRGGAKAAGETLATVTIPSPATNLYITVPFTDEQRLYTLFVEGQKLGTTYIFSKGSAKVLTDFDKEKRQEIEPHAARGNIKLDGEQFEHHTFS